MSKTSSSREDRVDLRRDGGVSIVTMQDPAHRNVLSPDMVEQLVAAFDEVESDGETCCVVLTGEGPAFLCRCRAGRARGVGLG